MAKRWRLGLGLVLGVAGLLKGAAEVGVESVSFHSPHRSMIVVPVRVNGQGPYSFVLDTGATSSAMDPQLVAALHLPVAPGVRLASWNDAMDVRRVRAESLALGPVDSGPVNVLVRTLAEFKVFEPGIRGVGGQDVLLRANYLIDYRTRRIEFDHDGVLLGQMTGRRVAMEPVRTRAGDLEARLIGISVRGEGAAEGMELLLDSGADMLVLQPSLLPPASVPRGAKWIANENGRISAAAAFHARLSVGAEEFSAEVWVGETGLKQLAIGGLLPTSSFDEVYVGNQGSFVIFNPGRVDRPRRRRWSW